jgi:PBP1b-binding outer membrane lipoprotein LpoB
MKTSRFFIVLFIALLLSACAESSRYNTPQATQTPDIYVEAVQIRATADAANDEAVLREQFLTATAQAPIIQITQTAAAVSVGSTQQAVGMTATAAYFTPTPIPTSTPMPTSTPNFTATVGAAQASAVGTQIANNTARDGLQLEREKALNAFYATLPVLTFVIAVGVLFLALVWVARRERYRSVSVDARGAPIPLIDVVDGTVMSIDRSPNHRAEIGENLARQWLREKLGLQPLLPAVTAERQDRTTERDQMVALATRGLPGQNQAGRKVVDQAVTAQHRPDLNLQGRFRVLEGGGEHLSILDDQIVQVLDADWRKVDDG